MTVDDAKELIESLQQQKEGVQNQVEYHEGRLQHATERLKLVVTTIKTLKSGSLVKASISLRNSTWGWSIVAIPSPQQESENSNE